MGSVHFQGGMTLGGGTPQSPHQDCRTQLPQLLTHIRTALDESVISTWPRPLPRAPVFNDLFKKKQKGLAQLQSSPWGWPVSRLPSASPSAPAASPPSSPRTGVWRALPTKSCMPTPSQRWLSEQLTASDWCHLVLSLLTLDVSGHPRDTQVVNRVLTLVRSEDAQR